jgi:hypothetical protein
MDNLDSLFDQFVEALQDIADKMFDSVGPFPEPDPDLFDNEDDYTMAVFASSRIVFDPLNKEISIVKDIISRVRRAIDKNWTTTNDFHRVRIRKVMFATEKFRMALYLVQNCGEPPESFKGVESVIIAFRSLLEQFNECIKIYNEIHPDSKLIPSSVPLDVSPITVSNSGLKD